MPKPIINASSQKLQDSFTVGKELSMQGSSFEERNTFKSSELILRKKRPQSYMELIKNLDLEGYSISKDKIKEIVENVQNSVPDVVYDDTFLGILGKCHLGDGYDVHTLSLNLVLGVDERTNTIGYGRMILKHYKVNESLPPELEKGRSLAINPNYVFVEIYRDKLIAINPDGSASIVKDKG